MADLIENSVGALEEVHLSHNRLSKYEVRQLLEATARRKEYPLHGSRPLWLRVEHNPACDNLSVDLMAEADRKLASIRKEMSLLPAGVSENMICVVPWVSDGCRASYCRRAHRYGPIVHLPYFWDRTKEKKARGDEKEYYKGPDVPSWSSRGTAQGEVYQDEIDERDAARMLQELQAIFRRDNIVENEDEEWMSSRQPQGITEQDIVPLPWPSWSEVASQRALGEEIGETVSALFGEVKPPIDEKLVQRLIDYLRQASSPERAKQVILDPRSNISRRAAEEAIRRFDL